MRDSFDWVWLLVNLGLLISCIFISVSAFIGGGLATGFLTLGVCSVVITIINALKYC